MPTPELSNPKRRDGAALIADLRKRGSDIGAAFWFYREELNEWRLILATPAIETQGPRRLLRQAAQFISGLNGGASLSLSDIEFESPNNPDVAVLGIMIPSRESGSLTIRRENYGGVEFDKFIVYFIHPEALLDGAAPFRHPSELISSSDNEE
jgi:hypothetical protein